MNTSIGYVEVEIKCLLDVVSFGMRDIQQQRKSETKENIEAFKNRLKGFWFRFFNYNSISMWRKSETDIENMSDKDIKHYYDDIHLFDCIDSLYHNNDMTVLMDISEMIILAERCNQPTIFLTHNQAKVINDAVVSSRISKSQQTK